MNTFQHALTPCPVCVKPLDASTPIEGTQGPKPGDYTVCFYCGSFLQYEPEMTLRLLTQEDVGFLDATIRSQLVRMRKLVQSKPPAPRHAPPEPNDTANISPNVGELTIERIREAIRRGNDLPPARKITLFGSAVLKDQAFEIADAADLPFFNAFLPAGRRVLFVPKQHELIWFNELRRTGVDVELNPISRRPSPTTEE